MHVCSVCACVRVCVCVCAWAHLLVFTCAFVRVFVSLHSPYLHVNIQHTDHSFLPHSGNCGFAAKMAKWSGGGGDKHTVTTCVGEGQALAVCCSPCAIHVAREACMLDEVPPLDTLLHVWLRQEVVLCTYVHMFVQDTRVAMMHT